MIILWYFNVTGFTTLDMYDQNSENLLSAIRESLKSNRYLEVFGLDYETIDGLCVRDYVHVEDLSQWQRLRQIQLSRSI